MPREEQPSSRNKANRSHVQGQGFYLHKPSGFFDSFPEFPNIRTLYEQYQYIRPSILYKYWNNKNCWKLKIKNTYTLLCGFFSDKKWTQRTRHSQFGSLFDTFTLWILYPYAQLKKKNPYMINGLDGRHCFRRVSW